MTQVRHMVVTWIRNLKKGDPGFDALNQLAADHLGAATLGIVTSTVSKGMGNSESVWERFYDRWQHFRDELFAGMAFLI